MSHLPPPSAVPPGWYPDPEGPGNRYWDGRTWAVPVPPPPKPPDAVAKFGKVLAIVGGVALAGSCIAHLVRGHSPAAMDKDGAYYQIDAGNAGTYVTEGSQRPNGRPCSWTRTRTPTIHIIDMIAGGEVAVGERGVVTVNAGEYFVTYGCKPWRKQ